MKSTNSTFFSLSACPFIAIILRHSSTAAWAILDSLSVGKRSVRTLKKISNECLVTSAQPAIGPPSSEAEVAGMPFFGSAATPFFGDDAVELALPPLHSLPRLPLAGGEKAWPVEDVLGRDDEDVLAVPPTLDSCRVNPPTSPDEPAAVLPVEQLFPLPPPSSGSDTIFSPSSLPVWLPTMLWSLEGTMLGESVESVDTSDICWLIERFRSLSLQSTVVQVELDFAMLESALFLLRHGSRATHSSMMLSMRSKTLVRANTWLRDSFIRMAS
mmetsp:Transcript_20725/g.52224  ORF Transcript_20725/g.52224 Transcript_20725/m.52224 type:complete len:271 (+) Transcript_20725:3196-4008(+)